MGLRQGAFANLNGSWERLIRECRCFKGTGMKVDRIQGRWLTRKRRQNASESSEKINECSRVR